MGADSARWLERPQIQSNEKTLESLDDILHADTQQSFELGFDLTAARIYRLTSGGQLDFGGSEFAAADREAIDTEKKNPDDDYGWWHLEAGAYLVEFNETLALKPGQMAYIQPHNRLMRAGGHHPGFLTQGTPDDLAVLLHVSPQGLHIKENARISTLFLIEDY